MELSELKSAMAATQEQIRSRIAFRGFRIGDLALFLPMLAAMGISKDTRAQLLSHGLGGVQGRHYDQHEYMDEKRNALQAWAEALPLAQALVKDLRWRVLYEDDTAVILRK